MSQERKQTKDVFTDTKPRNTNPNRSKVIPDGRSAIKGKMTVSGAQVLIQAAWQPAAGPVVRRLAVSDFMTVEVIGIQQKLHSGFGSLNFDPLPG